MKDRIKKRAELKELLNVQTMGCAIQHNGWPCNSCFHSLDLGITDDRLHELWRSTLLLRGDYKNGEEITQTDKQLSDNIDELLRLLQ